MANKYLEKIAGMLQDLNRVTADLNPKMLFRSHGKDVAKVVGGGAVGTGATYTAMKKKKADAK